MNQVGITYGSKQPEASSSKSVKTVDYSAENLGKAIGDARRKAGFTQQELCAEAGLSYSTLAKIERGAIKTPSVFTVLAVAQATGMSIEELITGKSNAVVQPQPLVAQIDYKTSTTGVKFVYFDINGVIVRFFHRAFSALAQDTGVSATAIESTFWHYNDAVCRGEMSMTDFNQALAQRIGQPEVNWQKYYMASIDAIDEVKDLIVWASKYYKVGLLSNIMPGFIGQMISRGLLPNVDYTAVIDSSEQGVIKPEPRIYEIATERSGVNPSEILFMDDSRTNLMAAERHGWQVLWFDDFLPKESVQRVKESLKFD